MTSERGYTSIATLATLLLVWVSAKSMAETPKDKPNVLLIVADDMGYADLGCFGGEIRTPHVDALAARGIRATNFYASPTCSPTRAMLLTGIDNHIAGLGNMAEWLGPKQRGRPGYEGHLNDNVVSVATLLREAGYHTYMAGKWHLGEEPHMWPAAHGFERDFSLLDGAGSHWSNMQGLHPTHPKLTFTRNGQKINRLPEGYFSSKNFTNFIIDSINEQRDDGKPFFAYVAYQAPHGPLALPAAWRDKYRRRYDKGYDAIREERLARQRVLRIVGKDAVGSLRLPSIPAWNSLPDEQQRQMARKMELYAAMVENMDHHCGRLVNHLKQIGELDNTVILFLSDNGAAGEDIADLVSSLAPKAKDWFTKTFDNRLENWGRPDSCVDYGPAWAQVSMVPFRQFKGVLAEGGIRVPLIVAGPGVNHRGAISHTFLHVMDIVPTVLELTGVKHPSQDRGPKVAPIQGVSMLPLLAGRTDGGRQATGWLGWELFGNRAIRQGDWKLLFLQQRAGGTGNWQLFNLREDPGELQDLSSKHANRREAMVRLWEQYVNTNGVVVSDAGPFAQGRP